MARVLALALSAVSAGCIFAAIVGMVNGRGGGRTGFVLRAVAVVCFAAAVVLGTVASR